MSTVTLEELEKSFKENITDTIVKLGSYMYKNDIEEVPATLRTELERYMDEVIQMVMKCGGPVSVVLKWTQEVIDSVSIGDLCEAIIEEEEKETL